MKGLLKIVVLLSALLSGSASDAASASLALQELQAQQRATAKLLQQSYVFVGGGSGVVVDASGLILTNHHVAGGQERWRIRFSDGRAYWAQRLGTDPFGDICLLQIEAPTGTSFTAAPLGTAADIVVGQPVMAIGNPFSLGDIDNTPTVTTGTLGSGRVVRGIYTDCLQLDAAVNPGNSGGPCLSLDGKLLGINGQIRTRTGMRINSGIGLAISCVQLERFLPVLKNSRSGYVLHTAAPEGLELLQTATGVVVADWQRENPSEAALLQEGDLLLRIDDRPVTSLHTAEGLFASLPWTGPETRIQVHLRRQDQELSLLLPVARTEIPGKVSPGFRSVREQEIAPDGAEREILLVGSVLRGSYAEEAGVQTGWRILQIGERVIASRLDYLKATARLGIGDLMRVVFLDRASGAEHVVEIPLLP